MSLRSNALYYIAGAIIAGAILWQAFRPQGPAPVAGPAALQGQAAPSFPVPDMEGLSSGLDLYRGRIVVMNLWASWCPPCRAEMPDLERLYETYRSRSVVVLGVDQGESRERVGAFARALGIHYPILLDEQQRYGRVYAALGLPTTILVNRNGVVVRGFDGPLAYSQMVAAIEPLLRP